MIIDYDLSSHTRDYGHIYYNDKNSWAVNGNRINGRTSLLIHIQKNLFISWTLVAQICE